MNHHNLQSNNSKINILRYRIRIVLICRVQLSYKSIVILFGGKPIVFCHKAVRYMRTIENQTGTPPKLFIGMEWWVCVHKNLFLENIAWNLYVPVACVCIIYVRPRTGYWDSGNTARWSNWRMYSRIRVIKNLLLSFV